MKKLTEQEIKEKVEEAVNQVTKKDWIDDRYCIMCAGDMAVAMSREKYDEIMHQVIEETFNNKKNEEGTH